MAAARLSLPPSSPHRAYHPYREGCEGIKDVRSAIRAMPPYATLAPAAGTRDDQRLHDTDSESCSPNSIRATPPLAPGPGVLSWAQQQAVRQEYVGRTTPMLQVLVCVATGITRCGLQDLIEQAGMQVLARTPYPQNIPDLLPNISDMTIAIVTTCAALPQVLPIIQQHQLSIVCVLTRLADSLAALDGVAGIVTPVAIVVEYPDERQTIVRLNQALRHLAGQSMILASLRDAFATIGLSPQEQILLAAEVQGMASTIIADQLGVDLVALRQRRKGLRMKLEVPYEQTLVAWSEWWWSGQLTA